MRKFKYILRSIDTKGKSYLQIEDELNDMGSVGWELVDLRPYPKSIDKERLSAIFKIAYYDDFEKNNKL
jgi:hypothetical protein